MIEQRVKGWIRWGSILLLICGMTVFQYQQLLLGILLAWLLLPILTLFLNLPVKRGLQAEIKIVPTAAKNNPVTGTVILENKSSFPGMRICCQLLAHNRLTQEEERRILSFFVPPGGKTNKNFQITSGYCGYLDVKIEKIYLFDWFGIAAMKKSVSEEVHTSILPETFQPHILLEQTQIRQEEAEHWSPTEKGYDQSEVFSLRDYVPGDSLRQIHWKLSAKKGQMIVKEGSLPIEKSLLFFWNKNVATAKPEEMDAMAECAVSLCQSLIRQGMIFWLGWTEGREIRLEEIRGEDQLLSSIPQMLKHGYEAAEYSADQMERNTYSKVIYLSAAMPEEDTPFGCEDTTFLLCNPESTDSIPNRILFDSRTYREDLDYIEL